MICPAWDRLTLFFYATFDFSRLLCFLSALYVYIFNHHLQVMHTHTSTANFLHLFYWWYPQNRLETHSACGRIILLSFFFHSQHLRSLLSLLFSYLRFNPIAFKLTVSAWISDNAILEYTHLAIHWEIQHDVRSQAWPLTKRMLCESKSEFMHAALLRNGRIIISFADSLPDFCFFPIPLIIVVVQKIITILKWAMRWEPIYMFIYINFETPSKFTRTRKHRA